MHKQPSNLNEVRDNLSEAAYTAWIDKSFVPRAVVMVNAMGKIVSSVALSLKAAELGKTACQDTMLLPARAPKAIADTQEEK